MATMPNPTITIFWRRPCFGADLEMATRPGGSPSKPSSTAIAAHAITSLMRYEENYAKLHYLWLLEQF